MKFTALSAFLSTALASTAATELRLSGYEEVVITGCHRYSGKLKIWPTLDNKTYVTAKNPKTKEEIMILVKNSNIIESRKGFTLIQLTKDEIAFFPDMKPKVPQLSIGSNQMFKCSANTPIGLDVDGSGSVERIEGNFFMDISGDGDVEHIHEWFAPTEGILIDAALATKDGVISAEHFASSHTVANSRELKKHSGAITGKHLFGDMGSLFADGFEKLSVHDGNKDGSVAGSELQGLAVWVDANSNAKVDAGELNTLASYGIVGLNTSHDNNFVSSSKLMDGSTMVTEDLWFA